MEHNSSFNNQLRREITARAVINKKIKMLKADIDVNNKKIFDVNKETKRVKKLIPKRKQKKQKLYRSSFETYRIKEIKNRA